RASSVRTSSCGGVESSGARRTQRRAVWAERVPCTLWSRSVPVMLSSVYHRVCGNSASERRNPLKNANPGTSPPNEGDDALCHLLGTIRRPERVEGVPHPLAGGF